MIQFAKQLSSIISIVDGRIIDFNAENSLNFSFPILVIPSLIIIAYDVFKIFRLIILRSKIVALDVVKPEIVSLPVEEEQEDKKE